jgi:predicted GNAT family acetyltransferase
MRRHKRIVRGTIFSAIVKIRYLFKRIFTISTKIAHISDFCESKHMEPYNVINNQQRQQFQAQVEGEIAFLEYRLHDGAVVLMHTEVPEQLGGRGIGSALVAAAFEHAKAQHLKVKVYCPFVKTWLNRHPEYSEFVLPPS